MSKGQLSPTQHEIISVARLDKLGMPDAIDSLLKNDYWSRPSDKVVNKRRRQEQLNNEVLAAERLRSISESAYAQARLVPEVQENEDKRYKIESAAETLIAVANYLDEKKTPEEHSSVAKGQKVDDEIEVLLQQLLRQREEISIRLLGGIALIADPREPKQRRAGGDNDELYALRNVFAESQNYQSRMWLARMLRRAYWRRKLKKQPVRREEKTQQTGVAHTAFLREQPISPPLGRRAPGRPPISERKREEVYGELLLGRTFAQASAQVGVSVETVAKIARAEGIRSPHARLPDEERAQILLDLEQDSNLARVGRKHGVSGKTIGRIAEAERRRRMSQTRHHLTTASPR